MTIALVIGQEFELRQLTPLVEDISEERLLDVLEEALAARVIEELPQAAGLYQFTHALIQETLSEELTLTRRVRLHARIAESLEELYGDNAELLAAELAHHFAEAEAISGGEKLVIYSVLAGERALAAYAWEEALVTQQFGGGSSFAWTLAHVTNQLDAWVNVRSQDRTAHQYIGQARFRIGGSGAAEDLQAIQKGIYDVREAAR